MRELGVTRWGDIQLGPAPMAPTPPPQEYGEDEREQQHRVATLHRLKTALGSSSHRPTDEWLKRFEASGIDVGRR